MSNRHFDTVIIGSGPAGYTAALYASRAGLSTAIITGSYDAGGALMNTTIVENFPGFPEGIMGPELMEKMESQCTKFGAIIIDDTVDELFLHDKVKTLITEDGETIKADTIILAMGSQYRHLNIPGEEEYGGNGVSYCATCDASFFANEETIVVGGGDSALEEAMHVANFASHVTIIHRRESFRASQAMINKLDRYNNISIIWNSALEEIKSQDSEKVSSVILKNLINHTEEEIPVTGIFIAVGSDPRSQIIAHQIDLTHRGHVQTDGITTKTNLPGVFACGDLVDDKYCQAITAAASGCKAALDAQEYLER